MKGAIVTDLQAKGSAEKAGLKRGDVVVRFDGRDVMDSGHLRNLIAAAAIGSKHRLDLVRDGKTIQVELTVQEAPRERAKKSQATTASASGAHPLSGVVFDDVTPPLARQMDLPVTSGVVVTDIEEGSSAESSGLQPGDIILELNRQPIPNFSTFQRLADPMKSNRAGPPARQSTGHHHLHPRPGRISRSAVDAPRPYRYDRSTNVINVASQS